MTAEEKQAIQHLVMQQVIDQQQQNPTMLIDALLSDQGYAFVYQILSKTLAQHTQLANLENQLMKALVGGRASSEDAA